MLGVAGVKVRNARQAADLLRGKNAAGLRVLTTTKIEISADAARIPVGIDGESVSMSTPVTCTISPSALRVWVPRDRPGVPAPKPPVNWARLRHLAGVHRERAEVTAMRAALDRATDMGDVVRRAGELSAQTMIFDVEPLVAYWDGGQEALDQGISRVLSEVAVLPAVRVVCFATNS